MERPITRQQSRTNGFMASLHLIVYYGIALSLWGMALKGNLIWFSLAGVLLASLISAVFVYPVVSSQRSEERTRELMFAIGATWGNIGILIGVLGLIALIVRLIFF